MSGPMPAGSPSVSARTCAIRLLAGFDHGGLTQLAQVLLRFLVEAVSPEFLERFPALRRIDLGRDFGAHRERFNTVPGDLGGSQLAERHAVQDLAEVLRQVGR